MVERRTFLRGSVGLACGGVAGCIRIGDAPTEHLAWSTSLGADPDPVDARDVAYADGTVAAVTGTRLFGVSETGDRRWELFERPTRVFGVGDGFLVVDWPGYHPRAEANEASITKVTPDGDVSWESDGYVLLDVAVGPDRFFVLHERESDVAVTACDRADGTERWSTRADDSTTVVRLAANRVIAAGDDVVGYDRASGDREWQTEAFDRYWPPTTDRGRVYLTRKRDSYRVRVIAAGSGDVVAEYGVGSSLAPNNGPLVVHEGIGLGSGYDGEADPFFAVDPDTGDVHWWTVPEDEVTLAQPRTGVAFMDGTAYLFTYRYVLQAVDSNTGSVQWTFDAEREFPAVTARRGTVYVLAGGTIHALDPSATD